MKIRPRNLLLILLTSSVLLACNVNSSIMLKTKKGYKFDDIPEQLSIDYKIAPNDKLKFTLYTNDGFKLIDISISDQASNTRLGDGSVTYIVEPDGNVKLPLIGRINLVGKTIKEAEFYLEDLYEVYYNKPFVLLQIVNRRVLVFPGNSGSGKVIPLENNNVTLIEGLAVAGGISEDGKAKKVKVIRKENNDIKVYQIDLSTINGIHQGNMVLQANDVIYVEPRRNVFLKTVREIGPALSLIISTISVTTLILLRSN